MRGYVGKTFYVIEGTGDGGSGGRRQQAADRDQNSEMRNWERESEGQLQPCDFEMIIRQQYSSWILTSGFLLYALCSMQ